MQGQNQSADQQAAVVNGAEGSPWWYRELVRLQAAYRVSQYSKFQTMLYETVPISSEMYTMTGSKATGHAAIDQWKAERKRKIMGEIPWVDIRDWQSFEDRNPDPVNWSPTPLIGVEMMQERVQRQRANTEKQLDVVDRSKNDDWLSRASR